MKCPECVASGQRSMVYASGGGVTTLLGHTPYYDEDGVYHNHDPNSTRYAYHCSNGHGWSESTKRHCSNCEWPDFGEDFYDGD